MSAATDERFAVVRRGTGVAMWTRMGTLRFLGAWAIVVGGTLVVACSGASPAPVPLCDTASCSDAPKSTKEAPPGDTSLGVPTPATDDPATPATTQPEGGDAPAAGPQCTELAACCTQIKSSGDDSSVCEGAVAKHNEQACSAAFDGYKTYGPCAPPATVECTKLSVCCGQIKASGADSSVCEASVAKHNEASCSSAYAGYKTYGPCT